MGAVGMEAGVLEKGCFEEFVVGELEEGLSFVAERSIEAAVLLEVGGAVRGGEFKGGRD